MPISYKARIEHYSRSLRDCLEMEQGGVRGAAFIKIGYIPRNKNGYIDDSVETTDFWNTGIATKKIHIISPTRGSFDGGSAITVPGYGRIEEFAARKKFTAVIHDPEHSGNWSFYAKLAQARGQYHFAFITETELRISDTPVNIDVSDGVEEDVDSQVTWTCQVTWTQDKPTLQSFDARNVRGVFEKNEVVLENVIYAGGTGSATPPKTDTEVLSLSTTPPVTTPSPFMLTTAKKGDKFTFTAPAGTQTVCIVCPVAPSSILNVDWGYQMGDQFLRNSQTVAINEINCAVFYYTSPVPFAGSMTLQVTL